MKLHGISRLFSIISVVLCAAMLTMSVSAANDDAYAIYKRYAQKMDKTVTSMEVKSTTKTSATMDGETIELSKVTTVMKVIITPDKKLEFEAVTVNAYGQTAYSYYKDGSLYMNEDGVKYKLKMKLESAMASTNQMDLELAKEVLADATVERVKDGNRIHYKIDKSSLKNTYLDSLISQLKKESGELDIAISNINSTMTIGDDDLRKAYAAVFSVRISDDKNTVTLKQNSSGKVLSYNTVKKINYPEDLNTYKAMMY